MCLRESCWTFEETLMKFQTPVWVYKDELETFVIQDENSYNLERCMNLSDHIRISS